MPAVLPLLQRPFDVAVVAFLISHIPITILIDSQPFFPPNWYPGFARNAFTWYISQFQDPLMTLMPAWFRVLCWSEIYVQLPFFFIAAYAHAYGKG
ncbi:hypothetical protein WJX77_006209 [Trebouxia sp. C0004]